MTTLELQREFDRPPAAVKAKTGRRPSARDAEALIQRGERSGAARLCRAILAEDPEDDEALNVLGLVAGAEGRDDEAADLFRRAIDLQPSEGYFVNLGTALARRERWAEAAECYRQALALDGANSATRHKLGGVLEKLGRLDEACDCYRKAIDDNPNSADGHFALGAALYTLKRFAESLEADRAGARLNPNSVAAVTRIAGALRSLGRRTEALEAFERAKAIDGNIWATHANMGSVLRELGRFEEAVAAYRAAVALDPNSAQSLLGLGICLRESGRLEESCSVLRKSLALRPDYDGFRALGQAWLQRGAHDAASMAMRRAIELRPDSADAHYQLGDGLRKMARLEEACVSFRVSLVFDDKRAEVHHGLALALRGLGRFVEAKQSFEKALALNPASAEMHNNFANVVREFGMLEEACSSYRKALEIRPEYAEAMTNLATALKDQGKLDEAVEYYERALAINPDLEPAHGNLLFALSYRRGTTLAGLAVAHRGWNDRFARPLKAKWPNHRPARNRDYPRIGFVSADFNHHPVGYFTIRVLEELKRKGVEFVCYANQTREDALTERFRAAASLWRPIAGLSDEAAFERIRADEIDILFDMSGFMSGNRLSIFALKPAPVQVTWFGYMATTGLEAIDYILADGRHIPPGSERYYSEKVIRLPHSLVCFDPPTDAPAISPLPARRNGFVTFGSFNVLCKITPAVVETWSTILRRVPNSRLLLKTAGFSCPTTRARYESLFESHGVARESLTFQGRTSRNGHMAATATVDIALDPFPYVGSTTTVECAFMGVPVITWPGELFSSRHSLSFLTTIGATETIVDGLKAYEEMAVSLSADLDRLGAMRASLRSRMLASPLCDAKSFTADFEDACLRMWNAFRDPGAKAGKGTAR